MAKERQPSKSKSERSETFATKFRARWRHVLLIDERIRSGSAPNCQRLAEELEVSRRTVLRDIDFLKYDLGAPIKYDPSRRGYVYTEANWSMPSLRITEGELFALMLAEQAMEAYSGTALAEPLKRVFDKMIAALPDRVEVAPRDLLPRFGFDVQATAVVDPAILETVKEAVRTNQTLHIRYVPLSTLLIKDHTIDPYAMQLYRGAWYLAARDHKSGRIPMFNLSRMKKAEPTGASFDYELTEFDPKEYFGETFGIYETSKRHKVVIRFTGLAARLAWERRWHPSQKVKVVQQLKKKPPVVGFDLELEVAHFDDVWPWVLSWGKEVKVIKPKALRDLVEKQAKGIAAQYRSPSRK